MARFFLKKKKSFTAKSMSFCLPLKKKKKKKKNPNWILNFSVLRNQNVHSTVVLGLTRMFFNSLSRTEQWIGFTLNPHSKHTSQLRCSAFLGLCRTVIWCLETFFPLTVWSDVKPGPGRHTEPENRAAKHKPANNGNDRWEGLKPGRGVINHQWGIMYYVTLFVPLHFHNQKSFSFFPFVFFFFNPAGFLFCSPSGWMWKLHPPDRAVEPDPPVCVWNRRVQPHLHLRGPRTQVTGNQRRGRAAMETFWPSLSASLKNRICQSISGSETLLLLLLLTFPASLPSFLPLAFSSIFFLSRSGRLKEKKLAAGRL